MVLQYFECGLKNILYEQKISAKGLFKDSYYRFSLVYLNVKWMIAEGMKIIALRQMIIVDIEAMEV